MRLCSILILSVLTVMADAFSMTAETLEGYDTQEEIVGRLSNLPMVDLEGVWLFPATGQSIVIEREDRGAMRFRVVSVSSSGIGIESGTLLGYVVPTAKVDTYDASMAEINADGSVRSSQWSKNRVIKFTLSLSGGRLSFTPVRRGIRVNWWRLLPYMFRFSVRSYDDRARGLDGCIRLWPRDNSNPPYQPRYL